MARQRYRTLADYIEQTGETMAALARQVGKSDTYISLIASGARRPSPAVALRIHELTGVPLQALLTAKQLKVAQQIAESLRVSA